jgi:hypothetical protein
MIISRKEAQNAQKSNPLALLVPLCGHPLTAPQQFFRLKGG